MQLPERNEGAPGASAGPKDAAAATKSKSSGDPSASTPSKPMTPLPCPRCESMNTKFCYYNNYSITQPRHFCRQCQRYWTAGGTLRNVPVGGGSRKKSRHSRPEPYSMPRGVAPVAAYPPITMAATTAGHNIFQNVGLQHLVPPHDMAGLGFAHHHQHGNQYVGENLGASMQAIYGAGSAMVAMPLQMMPGGENSTPKPEENVVLDANPLSQKNGSPPHGSSTIEEEGSTPTNGYSNSGYEEGDAVSSMWHEMHEMDNVLFQ